MSEVTQLTSIDVNGQKEFLLKYNPSESSSVIEHSSMLFSVVCLCADRILNIDKKTPIYSELRHTSSKNKDNEDTKIHNITPIDINFDGELSLYDYVKFISEKINACHYTNNLHNNYRQLKDHAGDFYIKYFYHETTSEFIDREEIVNALYVEVDGSKIQQHGYRVVLTYNKDKYTNLQIEKFYAMFKTSVELLLKQSRKKINQLHVFDNEQQDLAINTFTQIARNLPCEQSILDLLDQQVKQQPTNAAVVYQNNSLTYLELDQKSLELALFLQEEGIQLDECVGLFVDPSIELMIGVWGILKSGAAYLPLSPEYPEERLKYMLENSQCNVVVVQDELIDTLTHLVSSHVKLIPFSQVENSYPKLDTQALSSFSTKVELGNLAYVIYTSGSTGKPKGVMIEHRSIANQMNWLANEFMLGSNNVVLQKTPMSFDAAQWEILAVCCGVKVVIGEPGIYKNPDKLVNAITHFGITMLQGVPTLLQALLEVEEFGQCYTLRQLFSGGEALTKHLSLEIFEQLPHCNLINLYGPTECTINSSAHIVDRGKVKQGPDTISIGKPINNTQYFILDNNKMAVDLGEIGELHIAGYGLARGYLHRKDLTEQNFIEYFSVEDDQLVTLYKTGDLAYWNEDGSVQYTGRVDNQVKLRGYRVELDEIKSTIETHDWVNNAAVFIKKDLYTGYQNLIAMIELNPREAALMDQGNHDTHHQSKKTRSQVKLQLTNKGCRDSIDDLNKKIVDLPGKVATDAQRELVFARKSYRYFDGGTISKDDILTLLNKKISYKVYSNLNDLTYACFGNILRYFGQFHSDERLLPKYGYASPGALYSTQMYLELNNIGNLASGYYYFNPITHQLLLISEKCHADSVVFNVHFIGKKSGIEPIYKNNILEVLELEAGHMVGFFENILPNYGLSIEQGGYFPEILPLLQVEEEDYYLGSFNIVSGKNTQMDEGVDLYVQAHSGKVLDVNLGQYLFKNGTLKKISSDIVQQKHVIAINQAVYERASFGISLLSNSNDNWLDYINLGRKLQSLQMNDVNLGFMSSGYSSKSGNNLPSAKRINHILKHSDAASYFFIGGRISESQRVDDGMKEDAVHMKGPSEIIQDDLVNYLPKYMLPNKIEVIDKMPLTVNGKIDFKALNEREISLINHEHIEPANDIERSILDVWKKMLKRESISVTADFFELGGNSLIAVGIINKINTSLHCDLPLQILFNSPTVVKLAQYISEDNYKSVSRLIPLQTKGSGNPIYCWPGLGGYCMNLRLLAESRGTDRTFFGIQAYGINDGETPYSTIKEMAARDVAMIKQNQKSGPYTLWGYSFGARVAFEACYQLEQLGGVVENLYLIAPGSPKINEPSKITYSHDEEAVFSNKSFVTILFSVFMGTINDIALTQCLTIVDSKEKFIAFICELNGQLDKTLVVKIIDIVTMTFEFKYSFDELKERKLNAPIKIIKAEGDDYSFIENSSDFYRNKPVIEEIAANHYSLLKKSGISHLLAVL